MRENMIEAAAKRMKTLMDKYLEDGALTEQILSGIDRGHWRMN